MKKLSVTLALFSYQQEAFAEEAGSSCLAQQCDPIEIILSDDASTDNTAQILRRVADAYEGPHHVRVNVNERNLGFADHINRVMSMATGEVVVMAAGDDVCLPHKVETLTQPFNEDQSVVLVHSSVADITETGDFIGVDPGPNWERIADTAFVVESLSSVVGAAQAFRRGPVYDDIGPLRSDAVWEDTVFAFRASLAGRIIHIDEPTTRHRKGIGESRSRHGTLDDLAYRTPLHNTRRSLAVYRQMMADLTAFPKNSDELAALLGRKITMLGTLEQILERPFALATLVASMADSKNRGFYLRAFAKRNLPARLLRAHYRRKGYEV